VDDDRDTGYTARLGARLRWLRRQRDLSLPGVEAASAGEFKASVLGAYERGERAISVPRLQRLARTYRVPVDQMVPTDDDPPLPPPAGAAPGVDLTTVDSPHHGAQPVVIDLGAVDPLTVREGQLLARFLRRIQLQRGDYSDRITVRRTDLTALAGIVGCRPHQVHAQLDRLGVRLVR
jgi:transcriptional regulator with XRE-family HTH domain